MTPRISVVIVTYNSRPVIEACLASVTRALASCLHEIIVVDNESTDGTAELLAARPDLRLVRSGENLGFAAGNNLAFDLARGRYVMLINPDARILAGDVGRALATLEGRSDVAIVGGRVLDAEGRDGESAHPFPGFLRQWLVRSGLLHRLRRSPLARLVDPIWARPCAPRRVDWMPGAFLLARRSTLTEVGGFDERFFLYWEEVDLFRRLRATGRRAHYDPSLVIGHEGGASAKQLGAGNLSEHGSQLTGWQWRGAWLYYRKHHGARYAWLMYRLECLWQRLRMLRADLRGRRNEGAERLLAHLRQSWRDTRGGVFSPPRPWCLKAPTPIREPGGSAGAPPAALLRWDSEERERAR